MSAVDRVRKTNFPVSLRGYDRAAVEKYVSEVAQLVAELEATQLREGVVQRALDEVGEQTSGILQHAHATAEEIAASSRAQAEGRLQRAEEEAEQTRREAESYAEQIVQDTRRLWEDRQRLIEDMRQLADEVLGVADEALDRLEQPNTDFADAEADAEAQQPAGALPGEEPTEPWELADPDTEEEPADGVVAAEPLGEDAPAEDAPAELSEDDDTTSEFEAPAAPKRGD